MGKESERATFKIGELARRFGLNTKTLRYYEELGLLPATARAPDSGYRLYTEEDARRLAFVLKAKRVGFSLDEIREVLRLGKHGRACPFVRETLARRVADVDRQMDELRALRAELARVQAAWDAPEASTAAASGSVCGLIDAHPFSSPTMNDQEGSTMANGKRQVEVFTAGCPLCDPVVELVRRVACGGCEVTVHDLRNNQEAAGRLRAAGVERVPMVLVDGKPAECCTSSGAVTEEGLRAAGVGAG